MSAVAEMLEASDLGWAPGVWPVSFPHAGQVWGRTSTLRDPDGDVMFVRYATRNGLSLLVAND